MHHVDPRLLLEELAREVLEAADAGGRIVEASGLLLGERDELLETIRGKARRDRDHDRSRAEHGNWRERGGRVVGKLVDRRVERERDRDEDQRVAVGRGLRRHLGADEAARAADVLDDDGLVQAHRQLLGDRASDDVVAATGWERNDEADRLVRISRHLG